MKALDRGRIRLAIGILVLCLARTAGAQESLDQGKSPAQLFASDCSICHKSPKGLARAGGMFGLDSFLREHYTTSREMATAIADYLKSMDTGPAAPARASKRAAKGDEKTKANDKKKAGAKPGEAKGNEQKPGAGPAEPKSEAKPAGILAPEPKSVESKPSAPSAGEAKPAGAGKSEKSE
jgi:hypothetical protein